MFSRVHFITGYSFNRSELSIRMDIKGLCRLPEHLSVILQLGKEKDALERLINQATDLGAWCACAGIPTLSIYERSGRNVFIWSKRSLLTESTRCLKITYHNNSSTSYQQAHGIR